MKSIEILFAQLNAGFDVIELFVHTIDCLVDTCGIEGLNDLPSEIASAYVYFSNELVNS